eukprot:6738489-Lingulodinium_polyedra.AAC.1
MAGVKESGRPWDLARSTLAAPAASVRLSHHHHLPLYVPGRQTADAGQDLQWIVIMAWQA